MADHDSFVNGIEILDTSPATLLSASLFSYGGISIFNTNTANSTSASFFTLGGVTISKNALIEGNVSITSTTDSNNTSTGALNILGGLSVQRNIFGNYANFIELQSTNSTLQNLRATYASIGNLSISNINIPNITTNDLIILSNSSINNSIITNVTVSSLISNNGIFTNFTSTNLITNNASISGINFSNSTSGNWIDMPTGNGISTGIGHGGPGVNPWVAYASNSSDWFSNSIQGDICYRNLSGNLLFGNSNGTSTMQINNNTVSINSTADSSLILNGGLLSTKSIIINSTVTSSNTNSGSLVVKGGIGVAGDINVGGNIVIGGNLSVNGTLVTVNSTSVNINDNIIVLNAGPSGTSDSGVLVNRYQISNNTGSGDVVSDNPIYSGNVQIGTSSSVIIFPISYSNIDSFYNGYWIKMTSGTAINNVRKIISYSGSSRSATLGSIFTSTPIVTDSFNLYGNIYASNYFNESKKEYVLGYTNDSLTAFITNLTHANLRLSNLTSNLITTSNLLSTNITISNILATSINSTNINSTNITVSNLTLVAALNVPTLSVLTTGLIGTSFAVGTSAVIGTTLHVLGATQIDGAASITGALNVLGGVTLGALTAGATTVTSLTTNQLTITNLISTNQTCTNTLVTNIKATTSTINNLISTGITAANIFSTNITCSNISTLNFIKSTSITANNLLLTGNPTLNIDSQNSIVNPASLIFKNTAGVGDFRIYSDGGDIQWQGGGGRALQMGSYHEIRLGGGRAVTSNIPFVSGQGSSYNTIIFNSNNSIALTIQSHSTQIADLQQWTSNLGNVFTKIDKIGNLVLNSTADSISSITGGSITTNGGLSVRKSVHIGSTLNSTNTSNGALVVSGGGGFNGDLYAKKIYSNGTLVGGNIFGTEYHYNQVLPLAGTTNTNFQERVSMTTSALIGGDYKVNIGYTFDKPSHNRTDGTFIALVDPVAPTTGTLIHECVSRNERNSFALPFYTSTVVNLTPGIHFVSLLWKSETNGRGIYISNAIIELFRVQ